MKKNKINFEESDVPMYDLGSENEALKGIYSVGYENKNIKDYMSSYYYDERGVQSQSYDLVDMYKGIFRNALSAVNLDPTMFKNALELGAGFGSGTYAMASLNKDLKIIATELSTAMLARHKKDGEKKFPENEKQIVRCQINADESFFKDGAFDIVFGTAILHHVFEPLNIIKEAGRILKPNGIAIFTEPFEPAYGLLKIAYEFLLLMEKNKRFPFKHISLTIKQRNYLLNCINIWNKINVDSPHSKEDLLNLDDKWFFPYEYFDETARNAGFETILKLPATFPNEQLIEHLCKVHTSGNNVELPPIIFDIIKIIDGAFSKKQKRCMPGDGVLILKKK